MNEIEVTPLLIPRLLSLLVLVLSHLQIFCLKN